MGIILCLSLSLSLSLSGHEMKECTGEAKEEGEFDEMADSGGMAQKDFIFIQLPVLSQTFVLQYIWSESFTLMVCLFLLIGGKFLHIHVH